jgi:hypothetical protein
MYVYCNISISKRGGSGRSVKRLLVVEMVLKVSPNTPGKDQIFAALQRQRKDPDLEPKYGFRSAQTWSQMHKEGYQKKVMLNLSRETISLRRGA